MEVQDKYKGKQYIKFSVKKKGEELTRFALRFNRRDGFYYCYSSKRLVDAKDNIFSRRPTWQDVVCASMYMLGRMQSGQGSEFGMLKDYSLERDQYADLRFSPVLVGKTSKVLLPVTIEDTGEILEDNFHLSYNTAMKSLILLLRMKDETEKNCKVKVEVIE